MKRNSKPVHLLLIIAMLTCPAMGAVLSVPDTKPSIGVAMIAAKAGDTIIVKKGIRHERVVIKKGVTLKSEQLFGAVIDGGGRGVAVELNEKSAIVGFEIRNASIGVYSEEPSASVQQCRITGQTLAGIIARKNLPRIEDNLIVYNGGMGIVVANARSLYSSVNHNTIAYNCENGLHIGGKSELLIENNIVAFNKKAGIVVNNESNICRIQRNAVYGNTIVADSIGNNNIFANPQFVSPRKHYDFSISKTSRICAKASDGENPGVRLEIW